MVDHLEDNMTPEQKARVIIDKKLETSGWTVQSLDKMNIMEGLGVAIREFPTSTGPVDYALFVGGRPVGVVEAKKEELGTDCQAKCNTFSKWTSYGVR